MELTTNALATPATAELDDAARAMRAATTRLHDAMHAARQAGVGVNEIARRVTGIYSRATALNMLGAADLHSRAEAALRAGEVWPFVDLWCGKRARVLLELEQEQREDSSQVERFNLAAGVLDALREAGLCATMADGTPHANMQGHLADGHTAQIHAKN